MLLRILITICLLFCLTACNQNTGKATIDNKIDAEISALQTQLNLNKQPNGKYKKISNQIIKNAELQTDEYETAKGEIGYSITITKIENDKIYQKKIVEGVLKSELEYDWIFIADVYKSSTSTDILL